MIAVLAVRHGHRATAAYVDVDDCKQVMIVSVTM
jgi:hypothetical protein